MPRRIIELPLYLLGQLCAGLRIFVQWLVVIFFVYMGIAVLVQVFGRYIFNYSIMKTYSKEPTPREVGEKGFLDKPQPPRTDMESDGKGQETMLDKVEFVEVEIEADND